MKTHALWMGVSALALSLAGAAHAQSTPAENDATEVQELVVTGERRATNLQTTAIAANVLNQEDLIENGVQTIDQLQFVVPSLVVDNFGQGNNVNIRGVGKGEHNTQTTTGVVTYRDGVASFPGYFQLEPYYDVGTVEVLRGPQGTFSGQNSTGGAIIVNSANPIINGGYTGYVMGHYGNYNDILLQGAVNLPVSDTFAARVAFNYQSRDTFFDIAGPVSDPNLDWYSARLSLLWTPTQNLTASFKFDYSYLDNGGYFGDAIINPLTGQLNPTDERLFDIETNFDSEAVDQFYRAVLKLDYVTDGGVTLRSVTGLQRGQTLWIGDIDGTDSAQVGEPNWIIDEHVNEKIWSQEFNIISPSDRPLTWVLGAYWSSNDYEFPDFQIGVPPGVFDQFLDGTNETWNWAGFGQVSYRWDNGVQLQAGLRYTKWSTTNDVFYFVPQFVPFFNQQQNETFEGENVTGKLALNWEVNDHHFLYAFVASGAKPGGLNTSLYAFPQVPIPAPFDQEYVTDFEAGWKARWFDGHVRTQIGAFYTLFEDFQVIVPIPTRPTSSTELNNPNPTKLYGVELSAQAVFGGLSVNANLGLQNSELGDFFVYDRRFPPLPAVCDPETGPAAAGCVNLGGNSQSYAPDLTFNIQARYDFHLPNGDTITPGFTYSHTSEQWASLFANPAAGDYIEPRDILGATLEWRHDDFSVTAYGYNLTDERYVSANLPPIRIAGAPRQFGIQLMKKF